MRQRVEALEALLARQGAPQEPDRPLPPPTDHPLPEAVLEAVQARSEPHSATARQLAVEAQRLLDDGIEAEVVAKMILAGDSPAV